MGKDWEQEEKGMAEDEMVRKHQWPNGHEFEQTLGDSEGQGGLTCCSSWGRKETATTKQLNNSNKVNQTFWMKCLSWYQMSFSFLPHLFILVFIWLNRSDLQYVVCLLVACRIFFFLSCGVQDPIPWPRTEPGPPALEAWCLTHWSPEKPPNFNLKKKYM